jgi:hypothetical protein
MNGAHVTPGGALPPVAVVVEQFRAALAADTAAVPRDEVLDLLLQLHSNNVTQWHREDASRLHPEDDAAVAAAKRDIDALNGRRHQLIEAIDERVDAALEQDRAAPPATESPGMVFDRLSVLAIRIHFTARAASSRTDDGAPYRRRLPLLEQHLALLQTALEGLVDDVRAGRKHFVPYRSLKLYGEPGTNDGAPS